MKYFFAIILCFISILPVFGCKYSGKIDKCDSAVKAFVGEGKRVKPGASIKSITDFPCLQDTEEQRIYQIVMDEKFKEIDDKVDEYLDSLSEAKEEYFGARAKKNYVDAIYDTDAKKEFFMEKYKQACSDSVEAAAECMDNTTSHQRSKEFLQGAVGKCMGFVEVKKYIFKQATYDILLLNKKQIEEDQKQEYMQQERDLQTDFGFSFTKLLGYLDQILKGWPSKTKHPL